MIIPLMILLLSILTGATIFLFAPLILQHTGINLADKYRSLGMMASGRAMLIARSNGGYQIKTSKYNPDYRTERITMNRNKLDFMDENNEMGRLYGYPFGMAHEDRGVIIAPRQADIGHHLHKKKMDKQHTTTINDKTHIAEYLQIPKTKRLIDLRDAKRWIQGSMPPSHPTRAEALIEKAYQKFNKGKAIQYTIWLMSLGAGVFIVYVASQLSTGPGGTIDIPMMLGGTL